MKFRPWEGEGRKGWHFFCFGCDGAHSVTEDWGFNGDIEKPTLVSSVLVTGPSSRPSYRCHSLIKDGYITFLEDCSHELKGKTVLLPDYQYNR